VYICVKKKKMRQSSLMRLEATKCTTMCNWKNIVCMWSRKWEFCLKDQLVSLDSATKCTYWNS